MLLSYKPLHLEAQQRLQEEGCIVDISIEIPTIESRASNIPMKKGITYVDIAVRPIKIFVEYVGTNMSIQVPLLVIDRRYVSVMST